MAEGQTATNPQTGERVILRGGQWVPLGGGQSAPRQQRQAYTPQYNGPMPTSVDALFPSLVAQESGGRAGVRGPMTQYGQALGRTQVLPSTARGIAQNLGIPYREDLLTGTTSEAAAYQDQLGRAYLQEGFDRTGNARDALMYYHGGPDRSLWGPKTQRYADEVLMRVANGDAAPVAEQQPAAAQTATNPQTGEKLQLVDGQWQPVQRSQEELAALAAQRRFDNRAAAPDFGGLFQKPWLQREITRYMDQTAETDKNGAPVVNVMPGVVRDRMEPGSIEIYDPDSGAYYRATESDLKQYEALNRQSQSDREARLARSQDPQYQAALEDARAGSAAVPDQLRAVGLGATLGFLTDINAEAQGLIQGVENVGRRATGQDVRYSADYARQAARDAMRDDQMQYAEDHPLQNFGLQVAGGLFTPGIGQAGRFIEGAEGAARLGRAAGVGAGVGVASGIGNSQGNLIERLPDAAASGLVGAGTGVIGQRALDAVSSRIAGQGGGAARRLSRAGVDLTPGQMLSEVPVIGSTIRYAEDILGGYNPLMGGVRRRQNEQVIRAAGQEALDAIDAKLPAAANTGREVYNATRETLSQRYDDVTSRVAAVLDDEARIDLASLRARSDIELDSDHAARLQRVLDDKVMREVGPNGELSGDAFKRIETTLRQQSEKARRPNATLQDEDYADALDEARDAFRNVIARQYPAEAEAIRGLNLGWATNARIRRAVSGSAGFARDGTPTPGELSQSVRQLSSEEQIAQNRGLLQGLAQDARTVLPATVGDTGSGQRAIIGGAIGALGTGAVATVNPVLASLIAGGAVVYSRPGIIALNALYRATDSRAANEIVRQLAQQAQENPALLPYYEAAVQHVTGRAPTDTPAAPQAQPSTQAPSAALQRVMQ